MEINELIEYVFSFTINPTPETNEQLIFLKYMASSVDGEPLVTMEMLEQAISERLSLWFPALFLVPTNRPNDETAAIANNNIILYFYRCYQRLVTRCQNKSSLRFECRKIKEIILRRASVALKQPNLYENQSISEQWLELVKIYYDATKEHNEFLSHAIAALCSENDLLSHDSIHPIFDEIFEKAARYTSTITIDKWAFLVLSGFVIDGANPKVAELIVEQFTRSQGNDNIFDKLLTIFLGIDNPEACVPFEQKVLNHFYFFGQKCYY